MSAAKMTADLSNVGKRSQEASSTKKNRTISQRSGTTFPVYKVLRKLKRATNKFKVFKNAAICCSAVVDYLVAEILEMSGEAASVNKRRRITPRHIMLAVRNDEELDEIFKNVTIAQGGVLPFIHDVLLKKRTSQLDPMLNCMR